MTNKIQNTIKNHILGLIFSEVPTIETPFDYYMGAYHSDIAPCNSSKLSNEGFTVCEAYEDHSVNVIKDIMLEQLQDLISLQKEISLNCTNSLQINKDEFSNLDDYDFYKNKEHAIISREGTADEFVTFRTISLGGL